MKKFISLVILLGLISCSEEKSVDQVIAGKDLDAIRGLRNDISGQKKNLEAQLVQLDSAIAAIDGGGNLPLVTSMALQPQMFNHYLDLQGAVSTKQNVLVYPEMAGTLVKVYVREGQRVKKGQLLGLIDDGGTSSNLAQMKAQAELAKTTYERQQRLWEQNIGSEIQYLQAKTNYEAQEQAVKQMESLLGKYRLVAPFSGVVDDVLKDQGTVVSPGPGAEVFRVVNLSNMFIEVDVPEAHLPNVTAGKAVDVYFPVLDETVQTKVRQTGNYIKPGNRSFRVEIPVPGLDGKVKPNMVAKVRINDYTNGRALLIPQSVVSENAAGEQYIYVVQPQEGDKNPTVAKAIIKTGLTQGDYIEVLDGIAEGTEIIIEGARSVRDKQEVKVLTSELTSNE